AGMGVLDVRRGWRALQCAAHPEASHAGTRAARPCPVGPAATARDRPLQDRSVLGWTAPRGDRFPGTTDEASEVTGAASERAHLIDQEQRRPAHLGAACASGGHAEQDPAGTFRLACGYSAESRLNRMSPSVSST